MASVSMNTANSRHETGQFRNVKACEPRSLKAGDVCARPLTSLARDLALDPAWFPIVRILAGYVLSNLDH
jgi:hypothetical protein